MVMEMLVKVNISKQQAWDTENFIPLNGDFELHNLIHRDENVIITKFDDDYYIWSFSGSQQCTNSFDKRVKFIDESSLEKIYAI